MIEDMSTCKKNHTSNNAYVYVDKTGGAKVECRECIKERYHSRIAKRKTSFFICNEHHEPSPQNIKFISRKNTRLQVCRTCFFNKKNKGDLCKRGHVLSGGNVYVTVSTDFRLERRCKLCTDCSRRSWKNPLTEKSASL